MPDEPVPALFLPGKFSASEIILYGAPIGDATSRKVPFDSVTNVTISPDGTALMVAVIYAYAFEGQCYRLDRTKVMIFKSETGEEVAAGFGFEAPYKMWRIGPKTRVMEFTPIVDDAERLILEANLPQNRSPNTYRMNAQLAHRSGRMSGG